MGLEPAPSQSFVIHGAQSHQQAGKFAKDLVFGPGKTLEVDLSSLVLPHDDVLEAFKAAHPEITQIVPITITMVPEQQEIPPFLQKMLEMSVDMMIDKKKVKPPRN